MNFWALANHADVRAGFRDVQRFSNSWGGVSMDPSAYGPDAHKSMSFLAMDDPPKHMRIRKLVSKGFTPRRVNDLAGRITALTHQHWSKCLDMGEFDYVHDFAALLPMDVVSELLGVPRSRPYTSAAPVRSAPSSRGRCPRHPPRPRSTRTSNCTSTIRNSSPTGGRVPGEDLVSALIEAEIDDDATREKIRLTEDEIVGFMVLMVVAGNETTTKLLANALYWGGWRNPDELAKVFADPELAVPQWTEETLRYDNSTQIVVRRVIEDAPYGDHVIPAGDRVLLLVGSANRDQEVFGPDADKYDIGRDNGQALMSFGLGAHFCLGAHLARLEANIGLGEVIRSIRAVDIDIDKAVRVHSVNVRGFAELPVKVTVR